MVQHVWRPHARGVAGALSDRSTADCKESIIVTTDAIDAALRAQLAPSELDVRDNSEAHRGHAGHNGVGGSHFEVRIRSPRFAGLPRMARHRLVYDALAALMSQGIHALAIDARAPGEA